MSKAISAKRFLGEDQFQWLISICCLLIFTGFVCSRALASIGMISLLIISLWFNGLSETLKKYFRRKELLALSLFFWIVFFSGIYSEDKMDWLIWVRIKLPYLALPIAFASLPKLNEKNFLVILYGFLWISFISAVVVLVNYFLNYSSITESFLRGNGIPMPFSHIRYTLMLAFSFFCGCYLLTQRKFYYSENEKWLQLFLVIFLFIALHVLSVRSSLLALYLGILFLVLRFVFIEKRVIAGSLLLLIITAAPFAALKLIPSLQNKWSYMKYDLSEFSQGHFNHLSDGVRIISMKVGLEIAKENLVLGIGAGDLKNEMDNFYKVYFPQLTEVDRKPLHNQLIWVLATTGIFGLCLFLFAFFFPLFYRGNYKHWPLLVLHLILLSSFLTEATLEEQIGTGFYLLFLLVLINHLQAE